MYNYMQSIKTKTKKWGNSLGIVIPKDIVEKEHLKEGQTVEILIARPVKKVFEETFGTLKFPKSTQEMKNQIRKELYDE